MKCSYCGKEVILIPSAEQRAQNHGGKPSDYTKLFTMHTACQVAKREAETLELMRRLAK